MISASVHSALEPFDAQSVWDVTVLPNLHARTARNFFPFLITYQAHPSYRHETQSTSTVRRRPRIDVRAAGDVVAWPAEPQFPATGSRKMSLVRTQVHICPFIELFVAT